MLVLGDIGKLRKETERPHHRDGAHRVELVERGLEFAPGARVAVAAEADGVLPGAFDEIENRFPVLFAQGVAEYAPKEANILAQRRFLVRDAGFWLGAFIK